MKRQNDMTPEDEHFPLQLEGVQYATGEEQKASANSSRKNETTGPKQEQYSLLMFLAVKAKSDAVKDNIA